MDYERRVMQLKDLGLLLECKVVFQATRDTWSNLEGGGGGGLSLQEKEAP